MASTDVELELEWSSSEEEDIIALLLTEMPQKRKRRKKRKVYVRPWVMRRPNLGAYSNLLQNSEGPQDEDDAVVSTTNQPAQFTSPPHNLPTPAPLTNPPIPARRHSLPTQQSTPNTPLQPGPSEQSLVRLPHSSSTQLQGAKKRKTQDNDTTRKKLLKSLLACREKKQSSPNYFFGLHIAKLLDGLPQVVAIRVQSSIMQMAAEAIESLHHTESI